jgi:5'-3' exonuclease
MKIRTLLVDGSNLLKRSFHGAKDTYTTAYGHIGGLYAFMTTIRKLIKDHMINKVVLVWDGEGGGVMRHYIDKEYKANHKNKEWHNRIQMTAAEIRREREKEASILKQRLRIREYAENLFLRQIEIDDIEADDLIAAYCLSHNNKEEIFLYSNDRDFAQLLDLNITILFPNIDQPVTKTNYMMHFNHYYSNALILKIISGDVSDNVKGVGGIKEDTLLKYFPELKYKHLTVRDICIKADEINKKRIAKKLKPLKALNNLTCKEGVRRLKTNFKLVNLREPMLNEQAREELLDLDAPLAIQSEIPGKPPRGHKRLLDMMIEDEFLSIYGSTFVNYVEPFYTVIMSEKEIFNEYKKNIKMNL